MTLPPPGGDVKQMRDPSGTIPVRFLIMGQHLRRLREARRLTPAEAGHAANVSPARIERVEDGRSVLTDKALRLLLVRYQAGEEERAKILELMYGTAPTPGWWSAYDDTLSPWVEPYFDMEARATRIVNFEMQYVPGLLQTEDYAKEVIAQGAVGSAEEVARRTEARMARQQILDREDAPRFEAFIDEGVLLRRTGGNTDTMRAQFAHLADMCEHPAVTLRVLPLTAQWIQSVNAFAVLWFEDERSVVYCEQATSAIYQDQPGDIQAYHEAVAGLDREALPVAETRSRLIAAMEKLQ